MNKRIGSTKKGKKEVKNVASSINTFTKKKKRNGSDLACERIDIDIVSRKKKKKEAGKHVFLSV